MSELTVCVLVMIMDLIVQETSYGAGKGVYTKRDFIQGEELFIFGTQVVTWAKTTHRSIQLGVNRWLEPPKNSFGWFLNHSCEPTAAFVLPNKIVASGLIRKGEEITIDYSTVVHTPRWEMECWCQKQSCRKLLRSFQFLPAGLQAKYNHLRSFNK